MASFNLSYSALRGCCHASKRPQSQLYQQFQSLSLGAPRASRSYAFTAPGGIQAASEEDAGNQIKALAETIRLAPHARPVPASPSYFSRQAYFNDSYLLLQKLLRQFKNLPLIPADQVERVAWKSIREYRQTVAEAIKTSDYVKCMLLVKRLHQIHPELKPKAVVDALEGFKREIQAFNNRPNPIPIDKFGRALGVGKRKESVARAWVVEGTGEVQINGKNLADAFGRVHDRESALWALRATSRIDKYNVWALVEGGGTTGQAEALTLAIAKALMAHEPALKPALRRAGCVTRDSRTVERKKHGHVKARKMPTWVKR